MLDSILEAHPALACELDTLSVVCAQSHSFYFLRFLADLAAAPAGLPPRFLPAFARAGE